MDKAIFIFILFCCTSVILGQKKQTGTKKPRCPPAVKCPALGCLFPVTPPGKCCPICPPVGDKPGKCPVPTGPGHCAEFCAGDFSCPGRQKCCSNGCGHDCMDPVPKAKSCSYKGKQYSDGETFKDLCNTCTCTNGKVSCTEMACILKPGKCPESKMPGICILGCTSDWSCPGVQKCCSNGCGLLCMQPIGAVSNQPNCAGVFCPEVYCDDQYIPSGKCCNVCPPSKPSY